MSRVFTAQSGCSAPTYRDSTGLHEIPVTASSKSYWLCYVLVLFITGKWSWVSVTYVGNPMLVMLVPNVEPSLSVRTGVRSVWILS